jgi:hypothetical protein
MLSADAGQLKLKAPKEPPRELLDELRAHKPELVALLSQDAVADADVGPSIATWERPSPLPLSNKDAAGRIEDWLRAVDRLPKACGAQGRRLKALTEDFALGPWSYPAVLNGWDDAQLFALDGGIIPEMSRRALHFRSIECELIVFINGRGEFEEWHPKEMTDALPWWQDDRCVGRFH